MYKVLLALMIVTLTSGCAHLNREVAAQSEPATVNYNAAEGSVPPPIDLSEVDFDRVVAGFVVDEFGNVSAFGNREKGFEQMTEKEFLEKVNAAEEILDVSVFAATFIAFRGSHCGWMGVAGDSGAGGCPPH